MPIPQTRLPAMKISPDKKSFSNMSIISPEDIISTGTNFDTFTDNIARNEQERRYLEALNVQQLNDSFNDLISVYNENLKNKYKSLHVQADVDYQKQLNKEVESSVNLSTGAKASLIHNLEKSKQALDINIDASIIKEQQDILQKLEKEYITSLTKFLGGTDDSGNFKKIVAYRNYADVIQDGLLKYMAQTFMKGMFGNNFDNLAKTDYMAALANEGIVERTEYNDYIVTDVTKKYLKWMLDSSINIDTDGIGGQNKVLNKVLDNIAKEDIGEEAYEKYTDEKKLKAQEKYRDWLDENYFIFKHTHLGLSYYVGDKEFVLDNDLVLSNFSSDDINITDINKMKKSAEEYAKSLGYSDTGDFYSFTKNTYTDDDLDKLFNKGWNDAGQRDLVRDTIDELMKLPEDEAKGQLVYLNYRDQSMKYLYLGNGNLIKVNTDNDVTFIPDNWRFNIFGNLVKK